jgi:hypothetical protein
MAHPQALDARLRADPDDVDPIAVIVSDTTETLVEPVAMGIETALDVRRTFGPAGTAVRTMAFGRTQSGFRSGRVVGMAEGNLARININGSYITADGLRERYRRLVARADVRPAASVSPNHNDIDGVVAHECWHVIEQAFTARRYKDSIEMRRALGRALGVETLEQALYGAEPNATPAERSAHERLRNEVSAYATTTIAEATAEMFKLAWCRSGVPSPIVRTFMELVVRFFAITW